MKFTYFAFTLFWILALSTSCSPINNSKYSEYLSQKYEVPECSKTYTYPTTTTLTGSAVFYKRGVNLVLQGAELKNMTLGDPLAAALPIRFAEVAVYDSGNKIVQCGATNGAGELKALDAVSNLQIPKKAGTYSVRVFSRMNRTLSHSGKPNFVVNLAVKKDKYTNEVYSIASTAISNGVDDTSANLVAYARQTESLEIEGGAFNILNSIFTAYSYIQDNTGAVDTTCLNPKLNIYWKQGFNPAQYVYPEKNPVEVGTATFYDSITKALYISGGKLGNINLEMTAHFDDYVIIHESAHMMEDRCGALLTPGGSHYIIARVDARLAWAEGWANYVAAQVMFNRINDVNPEFAQKMTTAGIADTRWTYLFASEGFSDSVQNIGNGSGFMFNLTKPGSTPDTWQTGSLYGQPFDKVDPDRYPGEGHFREGAVTRGLFKLSNNCGANCVSSTPVAFEYMWKSMDKITGIGRNFYPFKSSETFLENLVTNLSTTGTPWSGYKTFHEGTTGRNTSEALQLFGDGKYTASGISRWVPYGIYLVTNSGACPQRYFIEPRPDDPVLTSTNSDERYSNHYYTINPSSLAGIDEINVNFTKQNVLGTNTEFDLLLFEENYFFEGDYACGTYDSAGNCTNYKPARTTNKFVVKSDRRSGALTTKTLRGLLQLNPAKRYLLDIRAYTANKSISTATDYEYTITTQNAGVQLCPQF